MGNEIIFVCGARDYHAMDWYFRAKEILPNRRIIVVTDVISGEGFNKLLSNTDELIKLLIIDKLLFNKQSKIGNIWRNLLKLIVLPIQIILFRRIARRYPDAVYHAHGMYYLWLLGATKLEFTGTPQGSEVLVRPFSSRIYRYYAIKALKSAKIITVDSVNMQKRIKELSGLNTVVIQNGIDVNRILTCAKLDYKRNKILSIRGFTSLYRIDELLKARNLMNNKIDLHFIYPFYEDTYKSRELKNFKKFDKDYGRVSKEEMLNILACTQLVISIPKSDSSPRSVYEAIFSGCAVAVTYNPYLDVLPECMKGRIIIVDLKMENWLEEAIVRSEEITSSLYSPSQEAIKLFDQKESMWLIANLCYNK